MYILISGAGAKLEKGLGKGWSLVSVCEVQRAAVHCTSSQQQLDQMEFSWDDMALGWLCCPSKVQQNGPKQETGENKILYVVAGKIQEELVNVLQCLIQLLSVKHQHFTHIAAIAGRPWRWDPAGTSPPMCNRAKHVCWYLGAIKSCLKLASEWWSVIQVIHFFLQ